MKTPRLAAVGDNCIDRFLTPAGHALVGGNALNVAVQWALAGAESHYFGAVGPDADGARTRAALISNGVHVEGLETRPGITAYTEIEVLPSGERVLGAEDFGVSAGYFPGPEALAALMRMDHVHIGWLDDGGRLRRLLGAAGVSTSQDISVNARPENLGTAGLSVAFGSVGAEDAAVDGMLLRLLADGAGLAVVTRGPKGAIASDGTTRANVAIRAVEVVDTTGAGDSFIAGFLLARARGDGVQACLEAGRDCAARTCTHFGGFPQA